jgi:hypothetical protein
VEETTSRVRRKVEKTTSSVVLRGRAALSRFPELERMSQASIQQGNKVIAAVKEIERASTVMKAFKEMSSRSRDTAAVQANRLSRTLSAMVSSYRVLLTNPFRTESEVLRLVSEPDTVWRC